MPALTCRSSNKSSKSTLRALKVSTWSLRCWASAVRCVVRRHAMPHDTGAAAVIASDPWSTFAPCAYVRTEHGPHAAGQLTATDHDFRSTNHGHRACLHSEQHVGHSGRGAQPPHGPCAFESGPTPVHLQGASYQRCCGKAFRRKRMCGICLPDIALALCSPRRMRPASKTPSC